MCINKIENFSNSARLFYTNEEVSKYNYEHLRHLNEQIAEHSTERSSRMSPQEMYGLQPKLFIAKKAKVMLTMNLWASA